LGAASLASTPGLVRAADAAAAVSTASDIDSAATLGELVVTARRESERAIDVPIAMSVLTQDDLAKTGSYTLTDVQNLTPSFTAYQSNARNSSIGIRGIGVSSAADGLDTSVGVYIDNVYLGRPGMALEDLVDIDQFEVLRGPQGTLFGRNSSAGVVIISTEKPSFTLGAVVEASAGDFDYNQERLSVTGPLVDGVLAFRLTAYNTYREGVLPNLTTGIAANGVGRQGARAQLLWTPTPDVSVRFIGDYSREDDTCCVTSLKQVLPATITPATGRDCVWRVGLHAGRY
jgi:iron complex outermembrane receptor protein